MFYAAAELIPRQVSPYSSNDEVEYSKDKEVASDSEDEELEEEESNDLVIDYEKSDDDNIGELDDEDFAKASTPPLMLYIWIVSLSFHSFLCINCCSILWLLLARDALQF